MPWITIENNIVSIFQNEELDFKAPMSDITILKNSDYVEIAANGLSYILSPFNKNYENYSDAKDLKTQLETGAIKYAAYLVALKVHLNTIVSYLESASAGGDMTALTDALVPVVRNTPDGELTAGSYTKANILTAIGYTGTKTKINELQVLANNTNAFSLTTASDSSTTTTMSEKILSAGGINEEVEDFTLVVNAGNTVTINLIVI